MDRNKEKERKKKKWKFPKKYFPVKKWVETEIKSHFTLWL